MGLTTDTKLLQWAYH